MKISISASFLILLSGLAFAEMAEPTVLFSGEQRRNNLVSELLRVSSIPKPGSSFTFARPQEGWIFISAACEGNGTIKFMLDQVPIGNAIAVDGASAGK
jgi:hypothetical protein